MTKNLLQLSITALLLASCTQRQGIPTVQLVVSNPNGYDLKECVQGVPLQAALDSMGIHDASALVITDQQGRAVKTQLFDNGQQQLLLFECSVLAQGESLYTLQMGKPAASPTLAVADEMHRGMAIANQLDSLQQLQTSVHGEQAQALGQQTDSLRQLLDASLLGGYVTTRSALPRNPWLTSQCSILAEGPLMCAYQLTFDTLYVAGDTLVEHRTLAMQQGSPLTIVRLELENASPHDSTFQSSPLSATLRSLTGDSLIISEPLSYLAIQRKDSTTLGLYAQPNAGLARMTESRMVGLRLDSRPDSTTTFFVARALEAHSDNNRPTVEQELSRMKDQPLSTRIIVR